MQNLVKFLQGKKTYLSAFVIALAAICGWWFNTLDNSQAMALLGIAGTAAGLGAKGERYAAAALTILEDLRQAQQQHTAGQKVDVAHLAEEIAKKIGVQAVPAGTTGSTNALGAPQK
ncbi:MAG TPA: hypothetical protein VJW20_20305 [Candidatus Angelobacter sp.]|nr:hypothetical protein [Candidatus Angelobacter sp.]